jgi:hypothetical protein
MAAATKERRAQSGGAFVPISQRDEADDPSVRSAEEEIPLSHMSAAVNRNTGIPNLRIWRTMVFGAIGVLYLSSLFIPSLRQFLGKLFSYFPQ